MLEHAVVTKPVDANADRFVEGGNHITQLFLGFFTREDKVLFISPVHSI